MRLLIHDFAHFPFTLQMARWLAAQGHHVDYCWCGDLDVPCPWPEGAEDDSPGLSLTPLSLGLSMPKYRPVSRWLYERRYARRLARRIAEFSPDIAISAHTPPLVLAATAKAARAGGAAFVAWIGDIMSVVSDYTLPRMAPMLGRWASGVVRRCEFRVLAAADWIVAVSPTFVPRCVAEGGAPDRITVLPSWEPPQTVPPEPTWAARHGLVGKRLVVYAGTLGLKHDPALLANLAAALATRPDTTLVVATQGLGRAWLEQARRTRGLAALTLLDYQHGGDYAAMLAAAEVTVVVLEPFASPSCVPIKVWSYMVGGCPIVAAMPAENPAAQAIIAAGSGVVVDPTDHAGLGAAVLDLLDDAEERSRHAAAARAFAASAGAIDAIGRRFLTVLENCR